jgi:hypothetical protein
LTDVKRMTGVPQGGPKGFLGLFRDGQLPQTPATDRPVRSGATVPLFWQWSTH